MPVVTLVRLSEEEINVYQRSIDNTNIATNMSPHKSMKEKHSVSNNNNSKPFSKSITNNKDLDLFGDNKSLKIHPNKLIKRSHSKHSTKESIVKENKEAKKSNYDQNKNLFKTKEKNYKHRNEDNTLSKYCSSSTLSKTKSYKTDDKCANRHRNSSDSSNDKKCSGSKISSSKDNKNHSNSKKLSTDTQNEINSLKVDIKNSHSEISSNTEKLISNKDIYIPKKITDRRKSYHCDVNEKEEFIFKRRNSHASSKISNLESDKKLKILQTNKQLENYNSQIRKRLSSTSSDIQSDKENLSKQPPENSPRLSHILTKTADTKKGTNNENSIIKRPDTAENKRCASTPTTSTSNNELDSSETKRLKTTDGNNLGFSTFSTVQDTVAITVDKSAILPPINDSNSPYVSFGDFLKNQNLPIIESTPKGPEFSCTLIEGEKLLIKKKSIKKNAIVIDITDNDNDETNHFIDSESSSKNILNKDCSNVECLNEDEYSLDSSNKTNESYSKVTPEKDCNKLKKKTNTEPLVNNKESSPKSCDNQKPHKVTETSLKVTPKNDCDELKKKTNTERLENNNDSCLQATPKKDYNKTKKKTSTKRLDNNTESSSNLIDKDNTLNGTETPSKGTPKKDYDKTKRKTSTESLDNNNENLSNYLSKGKTHKATENSSKGTPKKDREKIGRKTNTENLDSNNKISSKLLDKEKTHKATETSSIFPKVTPKKHCDKVKRKTSTESSDNNNANSSNLSKGKIYNINETCTIVSTKRTYDDKIKKCDNSALLVESLHDSDKNSSDSIKKKRTQESPEKPSKKHCDIKIEATDDSYENDSITLTKSPINETKEKLKNNNKPEKHVFQKLQILKTEQAVEFITSDLVSVLNVYVDFKQYSDRLTAKEISINKELNNKDFFIKNRLKFLKSLCKKMQSAKVFGFKMAIFFDSLIESIKIHVAPKQALNEKTIVRFIHNVLFLFMENCSPPDDHYILYNQIVSAKSLQYLDQKSCFLKDTVDKQIFDCMNSFSIKLERPKNSPNLCNKESIPQIYCIDNSPNKITDVTPGNSLPCINTGENSVTKINPIKNIDIIPQISIADKMEADNEEENLIDILQSTPTVNNLLKSEEIPTKDGSIDSIESKLVAIFNEESSANLQTAQNTSYETNLSNDQTEITNSQNSGNSDSMNFLKNIDPNKSYLAPTLNEKTSNVNSSSYFPFEILFDDIVKKTLLTLTPTSTPKSTNDETTDKGIKVLNNIVLKPANKPMPVQSQCNPVIQDISQPSKKPISTEMFSENANSVSVIVSPMNTQISNTLKQVETGNTLVTNGHTFLPETTDRQLTNNYSYVENNTTISKSHQTAGIQNETYISTKQENTATDGQLANNYSHIGNNTIMSNPHPTIEVQNKAHIPITQEKIATNRHSYVENNTTMSKSHQTVGVQNETYPTRQEKTATDRQLANNYSHIWNNTIMSNPHPTIGVQNKAHIPKTQEIIATNRHSYVENITTMSKSHQTVGVQNETYPTRQEKGATDRQLANNYSHIGNNSITSNSHPTIIGVQNKAYIPNTQEKIDTNRLSYVENYTTISKPHQTARVQNKTSTDRQLANIYIDNAIMSNSNQTTRVQNKAYNPKTQEKVASVRHSHAQNNTTMSKSHQAAGVQNETYIPTKVGMTDYLNTELDNVSANSSPSHMTTNQISQVLPKPTFAPVPTNPLYLQQQYSHPVVQPLQPITSMVHSLTHGVSPRNPVSLSRQFSAPSQLHASSSASTTTRPLYLPSLLPRSTVDYQRVPHPQLPPQQAHLPNYSESVSRRSYSSPSLGAAAAVAPLNLQSNIPHSEITHNVTMKQQVVGRTLVHQYSTHTVHTQQNTTTPAAYGHEFTKQMQMKQQAEGERIRKLQQKEMLREQKKHESLRLKQQQALQDLQIYHQNKLIVQQQRELMYYQQYNNHQIYNASNNYIVPSSNPYTYQTYSAYPTICDKSMPQMRHHSATVNNLNNHQTRNIATPTTQGYSNNSLIYPPITYPHPSGYAARNDVSMANYLTQQTTKNPKNVPMQNNTVSSSQQLMKTLTPAKPNSNVSSNNAMQRPSHQIGNQQEMLRVNTAVLNTSRNETQISPTLEHELSEMEELLNITPNKVGTKGTKETNISAVRNPSRDSGYMTPTQQKDPICGNCLGIGSFICSGCVTVYYCSESCQTIAWPSHQDSCYM